MPSLTSVHRQDAISKITPLLPPPSTAPNMSSKFIATFQVPVCIVGLYFCSSYIFAIPFAVVYLFLRLLEPLIPDAHLLFSEWTFFRFLFGIWFLLFKLGINIEVLTYAGWLLMGVLRKREDGGDQKYRVLAKRVWWAATIAIRWTMDEYVRLFVPNWENHERENRRGPPRLTRLPPEHQQIRRLVLPYSISAREIAWN